MKYYFATFLLTWNSLFPVDLNNLCIPDSSSEIYEKIEVLPYFCQGWNTYEHIFDPLLAENKFKTVIEVGVFLGKWTTYVAKQLPPGSKFFAIDRWESTEELRRSVDNDWLTNMYHQFLSNMIHSGLTDIVIPVKMDSLEAAKKFKELNIKADLIYIDAAHDFVSVYRDLNAWFPMLAENGMFCGDDWHWGGVQTAVKGFAEKKGFKIFIDGNFWKLKTNTSQ